MTKGNKLLSISLILLVLFSFVGCKRQSYIADFETFYSMNSVVESATLIIQGKVKDVKTNQAIVVGKSTGASHKYTVSDVEILEVIYGDAKVGDIVQVKQLENEQTTEAAGYLENGQNTVLFLVTYQSTPASLINPTQGKMIFDENQNLIIDDNLLTILVDNTENSKQLSAKDNSIEEESYDYESVVGIIKKSLNDVKQEKEMD